jgi:hypothetical protein
MCSKGKLMTACIIVGKAMSLYDEIKITGRCTFSEGWLKNLKNQQLKEISKWNNPMISCTVPSPINPTPCPHLRVLWIHTLLYPGSHGRR